MDGDVSEENLQQPRVFSIQNRDLPTLQASILVIAAIYAFASLAADLLYARLNPKIRFGRNVA